MKNNKDMLDLFSKVFNENNARWLCDSDENGDIDFVMYYVDSKYHNWGFIRYKNSKNKRIEGFSLIIDNDEYAKTKFEDDEE